MPRYIDTEYKYFPTKYTHNDTDYAKGWNACLTSIGQQPTVDAQEVRHEKWIVSNIMTSNGLRWIECDCGAGMWCPSALLEYPNFCPWCGAKMDGERK